MWRYKVSSVPVRRMSHARRRENVQNRPPAPCRAGERAEAQKREQKLDRKRQREEEKKTATGGRQRPPPPAAAAAATALQSKTRTKRKAIRLKRNVVVRGIRIRDAASKQRVNRILEEEQALRAMPIDAPPPQRTSHAAPKRKAAVHDVAMD